MIPSVSTLLMLFFSDVWVVYGIIVVEMSRSCSECLLSQTADIVNKDNETLSLDKPRVAQPTIILPTSRVYYGTGIASLSTSLSIASPLATSLPAPSVKPTKEPETSGKIAVGLAIGLLSLVLVMVALETCYLRRKRRGRTLLRGVEEVETGVGKGSEERIVLESRVSIVFEDDGEESEEDDGDNDDDDDDERRRNGMSLPRRE